MQRALARDVALGQGAATLELLARIDEMQSLWWNACSSQQETDSFGVMSESSRGEAKDCPAESSQAG